MAALETGQLIDGKYEIIKFIAHGGYGDTYLAMDVRDNQKVALKLPDVNQLGDPAVYERFKREVAIGQLLRHSDLTVSIDSSEGNPPYLAFHYLEGDTLSTLLDQKRSFGVGESIEMVANLLDALAYCHSKGVYHRDIKPENLIYGRDGHLKIIDFGIAVMSNSPRVTWRGFSGLIGTPEYMSPEQIKGERGDEKSDIYSVGCLLYNILAGFPPYNGDNPMTIMYQHLTSQPTPLTEIRRDVPVAIWACIRHAMRRRKNERYDSADAMAADLRNPEKVDLRFVDLPDPPMVALSKSKHANTLLWIVLGIAGLLAVGFGLFLYFSHR
jgi:serine/threonine protein kinase